MHAGETAVSVHSLHSTAAWVHLSANAMDRTCGDGQMHDRCGCVLAVCSEHILLDMHMLSFKISMHAATSLDLLRHARLVSAVLTCRMAHDM